MCIDYFLCPRYWVRKEGWVQVKTEELIVSNCFSFFLESWNVAMSRLQNVLLIHHFLCFFSHCYHFSLLGKPFSFQKMQILQDPVLKEAYWFSKRQKSEIGVVHVGLTHSWEMRLDLGSGWCLDGGSCGKQAEVIGLVWWAGGTVLGLARRKQPEPGTAKGRYGTAGRGKGTAWSYCTSFAQG